MTEPNPNLGATQRGFQVFDTFPDAHASRIRVEESSAAMYPRLWVFCNDKLDLPTPPHLGPAEAIRLRDALSAWLAWVEENWGPRWLEDEDYNPYDAD